MHKVRISLIVTLLILAALVGGLGWMVYAPIRQERLNRALIAAIKENDTNTALALLAEGADANAPDDPPQHLSLWRLLLDRLQGKRPAPSMAPTVLLLACACGEEDLRRKPASDNWRLVKGLLERGAKVNVTDKEGKTPLLLAAFLDKRQVCRLLVERDADVNATDANTMTPLKWAVIRQDSALVHLLVNNGVNVNGAIVNQTEWSVTPLMMAQEGGEDDPAITEILLSKGASVNARDSYGRTALHFAILENRVRCVRTLLQHGADLTIKESKGLTPLKMAKGLGCVKIIQMLKRAGATK